MDLGLRCLQAEDVTCIQKNKTTRNYPHTNDNHVKKTSDGARQDRDELLVDRPSVAEFRFIPRPVIRTFTSCSRRDDE
jgi:hypothetical protein